MQIKGILEKIKEVRKEKKISSKQMAKCLGMSASYYCLIEGGKAQLKLEDYLKICGILNLSPRVLIEKPAYGVECQRLAEEIENLSNRDYLLMRNFLQLLKMPIEEL